MNENLKFTFITMIAMLSAVIKMDKKDAKFMDYFPYVLIFMLSCTSMYGIQ